MKESYYIFFFIITIPVIVYFLNFCSQSIFCNCNLETISHLFFERDYAKDFLGKKWLGIFLCFQLFLFVCLLDCMPYFRLFFCIYPKIFYDSLCSSLNKKAC